MSTIKLISKYNSKSKIGMWIITSKQNIFNDRKNDSQYYENMNIHINRIVVCEFFESAKSIAR